ncbi:class I SAM-dependent methyltransferase [Prolixibacteraceae bacterium Z1-6]|uniref:Class I SAM-dependent methyltransferase n=1 Tax=Draconibacterium aestuarii TaxID=2998507 RepID=A0A9X3FIE2_9BACT|nr:class I SAM-dependent methyltransferase [Prolixibacteraceae bacterium Z1-6]
MNQAFCPCCNSTKTEEFFKVSNAPVQSIVTIKSHEEAISIPRMDITLTFCNSCGFIYNSSFDISIDYYTKGYEDQQGFSPVFTKWINDITNKFINKYDVRNKDVVEIGCGKGDFLNLVCELGNNRGIGIDPAYVNGRSESNPNVSFIKEFYSDKHGSLPNDVILCRHTLEHIHDTKTFIQTIRKSILKKNDVILLIEVPSIVRILKVHAFWDIFNEHCSYFSPGSLGRFFRMCGFELLDVYLEYDNQYLFLEAKPTKNNSLKVHPIEESIQQLRAYVNKFVSGINRQLSNYRKLLLKLKNENKKVVLWGGGSKSVGFLTHFDELKVIKHVVDINPHIQGNYIPGIGIQYVHPTFLKSFKPDTIIIMNEVYKNEIKKMLVEMDLDPKLICL